VQEHQEVQEIQELVVSMVQASSGSSGKKWNIRKFQRVSGSSRFIRKYRS
jgi:hypothetical protein